MGKQLEIQLQRQDSSFHFQSNHPGCLWAILRLLDHHRWHNAKNRLPHKRNGRLRHPKGYGSPEPVLEDDDAAQVLQYFNKEARILLVEPETEDIVGPIKKLGKSVVTTKETTGKGKTAPAEPSRRRTAKNSSKFKDKTAKKSDQCSGKEFQTEKLELRQVSLVDKDFSEFLMKEPVDIMEMFKLNKKLFAEMLSGEEFGPNRLFRSRNSIAKAGLTKSMSFPVVDPSRFRIHRPSKLEHKQIEAFPKGKSIRPVPASKSTNLHGKSPPSPEKSDGSPPEVKQRGWNQLVVHRFNAIKQKLKQAFKDRRKGYSRLSVKEIPERSDHLSMAEDGIIDIKTVDETKIDAKVCSIKQTSFPIGNLDRYKHLFAKSFNDNKQFHHSRSLSLASENKIRKNRLASRSFNRNLSSPDLELFCSFFHDVSLDSSKTDKPIINPLNRDSELENRTVQELDHAEEFAVVAGEIRIDEEDELVEDDELTSATLEINPSQDLLPDCKLNDEIEFSESSQASDHENTDTIDKISDKQAGDVESSGIENAYYYQVRNIFEVSGLIESELVGTRRSERGKEIGTEVDQLLALDLVNEALLDINGASSTYFHKPFSFNRRILPPPSGHWLLEAVWKRIGPHLSSGPELRLGQSLEDVVGRDLGNGDDVWMKLQLEAEFLALDVEDLIIDQLLGELMCS